MPPYSAQKASADSWVREPAAATCAPGVSARSAAKLRAILPVARIPHPVLSACSGSLIGTG